MDAAAATAVRANSSVCARESVTAAATRLEGRIQTGCPLFAARCCCRVAVTTTAQTKWHSVRLPSRLTRSCACDRARQLLCAMREHTATPTLCWCAWWVRVCVCVCVCECASFMCSVSCCCCYCCYCCCSCCCYCCCTVSGLTMPRCENKMECVSIVSWSRQTHSTANICSCPLCALSFAHSHIVCTVLASVLHCSLLLWSVVGTVVWF